MGTKNLCFERDETRLHDILNGAEDIGPEKVKEGLIAVTSIIGEMKFNHRSMAARIDKLEGELSVEKESIRILIKQIRILQDKVLMGKETRIYAESGNQGGGLRQGEEKG